MKKKGLLGACLFAVAVLWWTLQIVGAIDTVAQHIANPGWLGKLATYGIEFLQSRWMPLAVFTLGFVILIRDRTKVRDNAGGGTSRPRDDRLSHFRSQNRDEELREQYPIKIEASPAIANVGDLQASSTIKLINTGKTSIERACIAKVESLTQLVRADRSSVVSQPVQGIPTIILRTEGQCRDPHERMGPFTIRAGEFKFVPVLWKDIKVSRQPFFMNEDGSRYATRDGFFVAELSVYGALSPTRVVLTLEIGPEGRVGTSIVQSMAEVHVP